MTGHLVNRFLSVMKLLIAANGIEDWNCKFVEDHDDLFRRDLNSELQCLKRNCVRACSPIASTSESEPFEDCMR